MHKEVLSYILFLIGTWRRQIMKIVVGILTWISGFFMGRGLALLYPLLEPRSMWIGTICLVVVIILIARKSENEEQIK